MQQLIVATSERMGLWVQETQDRISRFEESADRLITGYRLWLIDGVSMLYFVATIQLARAKLIWTDEFFTLYLSQLSSGSKR